MALQHCNTISPERHSCGGIAFHHHAPGTFAGIYFHDGGMTHTAYAFCLDIRISFVYRSQSVVVSFTIASLNKSYQLDSVMEMREQNPCALLRLTASFEAVTCKLCFACALSGSQGPGTRPTYRMEAALGAPPTPGLSQTLVLKVRSPSVRPSQ